MRCHTVMLLRHAEKPDPALGERPVDTLGVGDENSLSVRAWQRAGALVRGRRYGDAVVVARAPVRPGGSSIVAARHVGSRWWRSACCPAIAADGSGLRLSFDASPAVGLEVIRK